MSPNMPLGDRMANGARDISPDDGRLVQRTKRQSMSESIPTDAAAPARPWRVVRPVYRSFLFGLAIALVWAGVRPESGHSVPKSARVKIAVVRSLDLPEYNQALEGFISALHGTGYEPATSVITLGSGDAAIESALRVVSASQPDLILALGSRALVEVSRREKTIPVVYSMVLEPPPGASGTEALPSQDNVTGATLNISLLVQIQKLRLVFPTAKRIGVISDPAQTKRLVDSAVHVAKASGISIRVQWIKNEGDIPSALRALSDSIDVFWMLPDQTVLTAQSSRYIIFELIKAGVPIMGLSSAYVKAGALIALDCNYRDVGRQSGELAVRILAGQSPAQLPPTQPRRYTLAVNAKVREHIRIPVDEGVVSDTGVTTF